MLYDDNPIKQNLYGLGNHIPVLPSDKIYDNLDYFLIFVWRYVDPIMRRHASFKAQGRHFIIPLPSVNVE